MTTQQYQLSPKPHFHLLFAHHCSSTFKTKSTLNPNSSSKSQSMANTSTGSDSPPTTSISKRQKLLYHQQEHPVIPGLPDHIAQLCLSRIHPSLLFTICHSWRRLIYSPSFPPFPSLYAILSPSPSPPPRILSLQTPKTHSSHSIQFFTYDPISNHWHILPPPPPYPTPLLRHPSFLSRNLSIQSISVSDNLILLAATTHNLNPALPRPLIFNPITQVWTFGPTLATPRRWCALGACQGSVYVASGIGSQFSIEVARSLEKWDLNNGGTTKWEKKTALKDGRFSREAIDAVGWKGKLCMVNVKGDAAKEGVVYDVKEDEWKQMPEGMLYGWRGPVAAMEEEVMYVVDEVKGALRRYVEEEDAWEEVMESERLKGAEQVTAYGGRVCVVCKGGVCVVDVVAAPPRMWVVDLPRGFEAVAVHILPRMPALATDFSIQV